MSSLNEDPVDISLEIDGLKRNVHEKIEQLKINKVPILNIFLQGEYVKGQINQQIDEYIRIHRKVPEEIDVIKKLIFDNISSLIFDGEEKIYRYYMYVFDFQGDEYFKIYNSISESVDDLVDDVVDDVVDDLLDDVVDDLVITDNTDTEVALQIMEDALKQENNVGDDLDKVKTVYKEFLLKQYNENIEKYDEEIAKYANLYGESETLSVSIRAKMNEIVKNEKGRCPTNSVKIVNGHGSIIPNEIFRIPEGYKVITLSQTNVCIPHVKATDMINGIFIPFMKLYMDGGTIFEGDDTIKKIKNQLKLIKYFKDLSKSLNDDENLFNFQYSLHLPGDLITEMYIQTEGSGCENDSCFILCFEKGQEGQPNTNKYSNYVKFIPEPEYPNKLNKLSNILEKMGDGTYIIYACRYTEEPNYELSKTLSNNVRGPGYNSPLIGIRDDKLMTISTIKQPGDIDNKKIYRYHIDFLDEYNETIKKYKILALHYKKISEDGLYRAKVPEGGGKRTKKRGSKRTKKGSGNKRTKKKRNTRNRKR